MWLDIVVCILFAGCAVIGFFVGFMRGIIGFVSGTVSFIAAIFLANPLAKLLNNWFGMDRLLEIGNINGRAINTLICFATIYGLFYLFFFLINKLIIKIKKDNKHIDRADRIGGIFLGIAKGFLTFCTIATIVYLLSTIPFIDEWVSAALKNSVITGFLYNIAKTLVWPLIKTFASNLFGI